VVKFADGWKPDLITLGTHGRSTLGRMILGSVSNNVLNHARCSVRLARPRPGKPDVRRTLVLGWDGSEGSRRAARALGARHWPGGTELRLVTAVDAALALAFKASPGGKRFWLKSVTHSMLHDLRKIGLHVVPHITNGDPRKVLLEEARRRKASTLFVSARGLNAVERFLLGSVSTHVAAHAPCSVEVVR
jgi:nucleotide-binding universal stress UspA family protein